MCQVLLWSWIQFEFCFILITSLWLISRCDNRGKGCDFYDQNPSKVFFKRNTD